MVSIELRIESLCLRLSRRVLTKDRLENCGFCGEGVEIVVEVVVILSDKSTISTALETTFVLRRNRAGGRGPEPAAVNGHRKSPTRRPPANLPRSSGTVLLADPIIVARAVA